MYLDANNLYGWAMSQKLPVDGFKWIKKLFEFNEDFIKNYDEDSNKGHFHEVDVEYPKNLHNPHSDLPFLPERLKIEKYNQLACNVFDKKNYVVHIRALKRMVKTIYCINMNIKLRTDAKNDFKKDFLKLMNNSVFVKTTENVRKHRDLKLVTTDKRRNPLASEPNYHTTKHFSYNLMVIEMKKTKVKMNKSIYFGMSILDVSKTFMYEFWYDYIKPKYQDKTKLC